MIQIDGEPRFFPVDLGKPEELARTGTPEIRGITADSFGLRLSPAKDASPLALDSRDGSVGRLVLPQGFAIDPQRRCYFAERQTGDIWYFDPQGPRSGVCPFRRILNLSHPRSNRHALWSLAANAESLFIIRPNCEEVVTVASGLWAVQDRHHFGNQEQPRDVATFGERVYILTDNSVYVKRTQADKWECFAKLPAYRGLYSRLLIDHSGDVFVYVNQSEIYSIADGSWKLSVDRTKFPIPPVFTHPFANPKACFEYVIPVSVVFPTEACSRNESKDSCVPPELAAPDITREMLENDDLGHGFLIREDGTRVRSQDFKPSTQRLFLTGHETPVRNVQKTPVPAGQKTKVLTGHKTSVESVWYSLGIDSHRYRCRWDRVALQLRIPSGGRVVISTLTLDDDPDPGIVPRDSNRDFRKHVPPEDVLDAAESCWTLGATFEANTSQRKSDQCDDLDFLIRGKPGRYLFLRIELFGDGFSTPVVRNITAKGPRQSHVDFLPAVMREDDESRDFLERFVSVFQTEWDRLDSTVGQMDRLFNPAEIDELQLGQLASRFGIALPAGWNNNQYRSFLKFAPDLLMAPGDEGRQRIGGSRRGTVEHIRIAVRAVLGGLTGYTDSQMRGFPWLIEGYRERNQFRVGMLESSAPESELFEGDRLSPPNARTLWGPDSTGRLLLGDNSVLGERTLLPPARDELDIYRTYAHRIRIVVPACWVKNCDDLRVLETMIEEEKPAHVACEMTLVRPGMRIGLQSTVGVDTILGDWPVATLSADPRPPLGLGQGVVLPGSPERPPPLSIDGPLGTHTI